MDLYKLDHVPFFTGNFFEIYFFNVKFIKNA